MILISFIVLFITSLQCSECLRQKPEISRFNFFDTELLQHATEYQNGNVVVSPVSVKSILSMLLEGANGVTATEISSALRLSGDKNEFREQLNEYLSALKVNDSRVTLTNSNAMFLSSKADVKKEFMLILYKVYLTDILTVDFREPVYAAKNINAWVTNNTKGLIRTIAQPEHIDPLSEMMLANTLYFKSRWQHAFDPENTKSACFRNHGVCQPVAMMELQTDLNYAYVDNLRAHAIELPYECPHAVVAISRHTISCTYYADSSNDGIAQFIHRAMNATNERLEDYNIAMAFRNSDPKAIDHDNQGGRYSMFLLVPHDQDGVYALLRDLPYMSLPQISSLMDQADVKLSLPKFTIDFEADMAETLQAMKIKTLFTAKADLSGMFNGSSPLVNNIFHKVHIAVDEAGTVAAASSSAMFIPLINNGVQIRVDRPFVFFIRDNKLGLVLFEGKVEEPSPYDDPKPVVTNTSNTTVPIQNVTTTTNDRERSGTNRKYTPQLHKQLVFY